MEEFDYKKIRRGDLIKTSIGNYGVPAGIYKITCKRHGLLYFRPINNLSRYSICRYQDILKSSLKAFKITNIKEIYIKEDE